jgi:hypothetical protein
MVSEFLRGIAGSRLAREDPQPMNEIKLPPDETKAVAGFVAALK